MPLNFHSVVIRQQAKEEYSQTAKIITDARIQINSSPEDDQFNKTNSELNKVTGETDKQIKHIEKMPWYKRKRRMKQATIVIAAYEKKELNKELAQSVEKMKLEAKKATSAVNGIKYEIEKSEAQRSKSLKRVDSLIDGKFRKKQGFLQIAGYKTEKDILYKYFISEIAKAKKGEKANIPNSILFFGPQGNGKTTFATAFAQEIGCEKPIKINAYGNNKKAACNKFYKNLIKGAEKSEENYKKTGEISVLFIDEIDSFTDKDSTILPELKEFLNSCYEKYHCVVFAATNYPLRIALPLDEEKDIFPYIASVDPPSKENKIEILKFYLEETLDKKPTDEQYEKLADIMEKQEFDTFCTYSIANIRNNVCKYNTNKKLTFEQILGNLLNNKTKPNIPDDDLNEYYDAMDKLMKN